MTAAERWLAAVWPAMQARLPAPPARVVEIGCGSLGGFVPQLRALGYEAVGVDPEAPDGTAYVRIEFERAEPFRNLDAVVASTSLHHVGDPAEVIDRIAAALAPGGTVVVVEWDWAAFDEATAEWCFERLAPADGSGWLQRRRDEWLASGEPWPAFFRGWAERERLHAWPLLLGLLDERFDREHLARGPYAFADLTGTDEQEELAAIEAGRIRALRVEYAGRLRSSGA